MADASTQKARVVHLDAKLKKHKRKLQKIHKQVFDLTKSVTHAFTYHAGQDFLNNHLVSCLKKQHELELKISKKAEKVEKLQKELDIEIEAVKKLVTAVRKQSMLKQHALAQQKKNPSNIEKKTQLVVDTPKPEDPNGTPPYYSFSSIFLSPEVFNLEKIKYIIRKFVELCTKDAIKVNISEIFVLDGSTKLAFYANNLVKVEYCNNVLKLFYRKDKADPMCLGLSIDEKSLTPTEFMQSCLVKTFVECLRNTLMHCVGVVDAGALPEQQ